MRVPPGAMTSIAAALLAAMPLSLAATPAPKAPAPLSGSPRPVKLPKIHDTMLPNGLLVRVVEDHRLPLVNMTLVLPFGTTSDPAGLPGICQVTADLLEEGTTSRTSRQIADELAAIGGSLTASAGPDSVTVSGSVLSEFVPRLASLLADEILNPSFPQAEVALRKANMKQELAQNRAQPAWLARQRFAGAVYGSSPYARTSPTDASIDAMERGAIAEFHRKMFVPGAAILVVVGDVEEAAALAEITAKLGSWKGGSVAAPRFPDPPAASARRILLVDRPGSVQSDIVVGTLGIRRTDPLYFPALMLDGVVGAGTASRLFLVLREEKGFTYDAHSEFRTRLRSGDWCAVTEVRTDVTKPALAEILKQLDRVRNETVDPSELTAAKTLATGIFTLQLERPAALSGLLAEQRFFGLPADELETYVAKIGAVTPEQVRDAAKSLCDTSRSAIVVVGDGEKVRAELESFGPVAVFDAEGNPKAAAH
ncbi:MAG: insulinase family protein [Acidobacteria bacterium]|nr:insulinase family protein [Acidobacteriota bacterium]